MGDRPHERSWWWDTSCRINYCLLGRRDEPLCSRAWRRGWHRFGNAMQIAFKEPTHCESVHLRWRELTE